MTDVDFALVLPVLMVRQVKRETVGRGEKRVHQDVMEFKETGAHQVYNA